MQYEIIPYGESALLMQFSNEISLAVHQQVKQYYWYLKHHALKGVKGLIPAYNSITILFNPAIITYKTLKVFLENTSLELKEQQLQPQKIIEIPVCYDAKFGWDLETVSQKTALSIPEIIHLHSTTTYLVYMLGFAPGFMYLGGLNKKLQVPRKSTPRLKIPAGAVGLADQQTGIYPLETPGGWQIIGQTPLQLFSKQKPALANMGDLVKFVPISKQEFVKMQQACK